MILSPEAEAQIDALRRHYRRLNRPEASKNLLAAIRDAIARIEREPRTGLPAPRPYPEIALPGVAWLKAGRYWFAYRTDTPPVMLAVFYDQADIPGRLLLQNPGS